MIHLKFTDMRSLAIYSKVKDYSRADKGFGSDNGFTQAINVGSSQKNSHKLGEVEVSKYEVDDAGEVVFIMSVDGRDLKRSRFEMTKQGRAGKHIATEWLI